MISFDLRGDTYIVRARQKAQYHTALHYEAVLVDVSLLHCCALVDSESWPL